MFSETAIGPIAQIQYYYCILNTHISELYNLSVSIAAVPHFCLRHHNKRIAALTIVIMTPITAVIMLSTYGVLQRLAISSGALLPAPST